MLFTWCLMVPCFADGWWGNIKYEGKPWTLNVSRPNKLGNALNGRHISLWQSHGRYYDHTHREWKWQRPYMFSTTEDLFTQTIVVPYLIPMLENAGAVVFTPRERDMQTHEVIVDNDDVRNGYSETTVTGRWSKAKKRGFRITPDTISDGYNPFEKGTFRKINASHLDNCSSASYQPALPEAGRYAVYVSYTTEKNSVDDVLYSVYHKGRRTDFHVNQRMGGGTWVYLGTFDFDKGSSKGNKVVVSSHSASTGVVTTDAVRFGGGMGNIERGGKLSNMPRFLEGARYYAQWAGAPPKVYAAYNGRNDYKEDINVRSLMTNWLGGGSPYNPDSMNVNPYDTIYSAVLVHDTVHVIKNDSVHCLSRDSIVISERMDTLPTGFRHFEGKRVPFDLSLAIHSDAGFHRDMKSIFGSLSICTTNYNDSLLNAGLPREHSKDFACMLLDGVKRDLGAACSQWALSCDSTFQCAGTWATRHLYDKNYSESRLPGIPSAIFETLSHQSFPDMRLAHDPEFKFTLARSIYKTILHYEAAAHGDTAIVEPLAPTSFSVDMADNGLALLSWKAQNDSLETTAVPTGYNVYVSVDSLGYDNGTHVTRPLHTIHLKAGSLYRFRVTATNDGGESFPTEELCALYKGDDAKTILIVNGFNRLSSPAIVNRGFDLNEDPGLSYGPTGCWYEKTGKVVAGNDFNYVAEHAEALVWNQGSRDFRNSGLREFNIVSASRQAVEGGRVDLSQYDCIDLILGNQRNDRHSLRPYKTFTPELREKLRVSKRPVILSGSYIASDMMGTAEDSVFLSDVLCCTLDSTVRTVNDSVTIQGAGIPLIHGINARHYATTQSDVLKPLYNAVPWMRYADGSVAAITVPRHTVVMGFPLECIESKEQRKLLMQGILKSLNPHP